MGHFYISQSDKGGLVFGGDLDFYNSYAARGNLPMVEHVMEAGMALMPMIGKARVLRSWGGIMDMSSDGSPIIDRTPVDGLFFNGGWCYGGFKATPASGWCFAHLIATGEPTRVETGRLDRFARARARRGGNRCPAQPALRTPRCADPCPLCGARDLREFTYRGRGEAARPPRRRRRLGGVRLRLHPRQPGRAQRRAVAPRLGLPGLVRVVRDTRTHEILETGLAREPRDDPPRRDRAEPRRLRDGGQIDRAAGSPSPSTAGR